MGKRVHISSYFQRFISGPDAIEVNGRTVGECLDDLVKQFPSLEKVLFYEPGVLDDYIGVCINGKVVAAWEKPLSSPVLHGDEFSIIFLGIAGG